MDWKSFIAAIIDALAWPVLIGIGLIVFRRTLRQLVDELQFHRAKRLSIGAGGVNLEFFDNKMENIDKALASRGSKLEVEQTSESIAAAYSTSEKAVESLLQASPKAALIESFVKLELAFRDIAKKIGHDDSDKSNMEALLGWLHREAAIGADTYEAGLGLMQTRNEVVHANEIDRERAMRCLALAAELQLRLGKIDVS